MLLLSASNFKTPLKSLRREATELISSLSKTSTFVSGNAIEAPFFCPAALFFPTFGIASNNIRSLAVANLTMPFPVVI